MKEMGSFSVNIPDELEERFRREIALRMSVKKGNVTKALCEAIEMWIREGKKSSA